MAIEIGAPALLIDGESGLEAAATELLPRRNLRRQPLAKSSRHGPISMRAVSIEACRYPLRRRPERLMRHGDELRWREAHRR